MLGQHEVVRGLASLSHEIERTFGGVGIMLFVARLGVMGSGAIGVTFHHVAYLRGLGLGWSPRWWV